MHPLEKYLESLREIQRFGVKETSGYGTLETLFNEIGKSLSPRVRCVIHPANRGAGIPDGGLFTAEQFRDTPAEQIFAKQLPIRGAIEVKSTKDDVKKIALTEQVTKYLHKYGQVLVTNYYQFLLVGKDRAGNPVLLEAYQLTPDEASFWTAATTPALLAKTQGERFVEYLKRVMLYNAPIASPSDVARFLASYARDALARIEQADLSALQDLQQALEKALGITFTEEKGRHFFRSTLIQTLFYGVFSSWVLWCKERPMADDERFDWKQAEWSLHVPFIRSLFHQIADPAHLRQLGLVEVLNWTGSLLNRVERANFFARFEEDHAVQYFYEPFLREFDPGLRKDLGVWYTPPEIVRYMVARVDTVLREELNLPDGLANENVYVLDPCCGTGAYLVEVLKHINATLQANGDALSAGDVKRAALKRVFGFEILPAPFVVAHLQLGLLLQNLGVPLTENNTERAGIYLTNALTGWEQGEQQVPLPGFPELQHEAEDAAVVKRKQPILVILGNPPYDGFAGVSPKEENGLVEPYKAGLISEWGIKKFNLDDLYVRFFRLAERRITEGEPGKGIVCFISNFSYLTDPSFVVMRQRFLKEFDALWFDSLNGDSRETGKLTPEGKPDPSVFSTEYNREGIRVGTAIGLMMRREQRSKQPAVRFRQFWGATKRNDLYASLAVQQFNQQYEVANPVKENRLSFRPLAVAAHYLEWPKLTDLCRTPPFNGPVERRAMALISIERQPLSSRINAYFDVSISDNDVAKIYPSLMMTGNRIVGPDARKKILSEFIYNESRIVRYPFKPFDTRWCYLDNLRPLFSEPSPQLLEQRSAQNAFFISRDTADKDIEGPPFYFSPLVCDYDSITGHARHFPIFVRDKIIKNSNVNQGALFENDIDVPKANLSTHTRAYLAEMGITEVDSDSATASLIWMHALSIGFTPAYLSEHEDGVRQDWPRIPLPADAAQLRASARLGAQIAALLDTEQQHIMGVTGNPLRPEMHITGSISRVDGRALDIAAGELSVTAGWGHLDDRNATMPGRGKTIEREYTPEEMAAIESGAGALGLMPESALALLGETTYDVYLNDVAYWRNLPARVWDYTIGGYQVIKKWLSYRERGVLGRDLTADEAREVTQMARRIAAILLLEPQLDQNYREVVANTYAWPH